MLKRLVIRGYRRYQDLTFEPHASFNILVGDNDAGKSTILEAINLALTGRINGRQATEELHPFWFNQVQVAEFFAARKGGKAVAAPEILIEVTLEDRDDLARLSGAVNSYVPSTTLPGVTMRVRVDPEYSVEFEQFVAETMVEVLPVEYYRIDWSSFQGSTLTQRPKQLSTALIDSRTVRSGTGVDYHLKQILNDHLSPEDRAKVSVAFREVKAAMTDDHLKKISATLSEREGSLPGQVLSLAMDQSSRSSWDSAVVPHVNDIPFSLAGLGHQAMTKISLAMRKSNDTAGVVLLEEPENHLSHTCLNMLIGLIQQLAMNDQQLFVATHSSHVLNKLGLDHLQLVSAGAVSQLDRLEESTTRYFQKLPGFDTLRAVVAKKIVLVEGPSDELLFEYFYKELHGGKRPIEEGIDILSMRGLSLKRFLELTRLLNKPCAVLIDNDGKDINAALADLGTYIDDRRKVFFGDAEHGETLEPQLVQWNDEKTIRAAASVPQSAVLATWMKNNKTEVALEIASSKSKITAPKYFRDAIEFIRGQQ